MEDNNILMCMEGKWVHAYMGTHVWRGAHVYVWEHTLKPEATSDVIHQELSTCFFERVSLWPRTYWFGCVICIICSMILPASTFTAFTVLGLQTCHHTQLIFNIGSGDWTEVACLATILQTGLLPQANHRHI